jgi:hypothetical protein
LATGQLYRFSVSAQFPDGQYSEANLDWIAPTLKGDRPSISIYQEAGLLSGDDVVLRADGEGIVRWIWVSSQLNTSNR